MNEKEVKKTGIYSHKWRWLLWWQISPEELKEQVEKYSTLKITKSAKGLSCLFCVVTSVLMLAVNLIYTKVNMPNTDRVNVGGVFEEFIFFILGFLIYQGRRWAIIAAMLFWTMGKINLGYEIIIKNPGLFTGQVVWWCLYMHAFYVALKVENNRREFIKVDQKNESKIRKSILNEGLVLLAILVLGFFLAYLGNYLNVNSKEYRNVMKSYHENPVEYRMPNPAAIIRSAVDTVELQFEADGNKFCWGIEKSGFYIILFGCPIYLFIRLIIWISKMFKRKTAFQNSL